MAKHFNEGTATKLREWMADTLPEGFREELLGSLSFFEVMKSGVILCELLNTVAPGTIKQKPSKMNVPFKQMENIGYFLSGCKAVGIEDLFLFVTVDLFEGKQLGKVLDCLLEIQKKFAPEEYKKIVSDHSKASIIDIESTPTLPLPQAAPETSFLSPTKSQMDNSVNKVSTLDDDLEIKKQLKYNPKLAKAVTDWIEGLLHRNIGLPLGQALKSGVLLCQIINAIKTDIIPPSLIYEGNLAFRQRENIGYYLKAVRSMSIFKEHELFSTSDLFEEKNMNNVIVHLHALAKQCLNFEFYQGPTIEDTSRTGNILGAVLIGNEITIDEETLENWTEEEKVIIDWANSILPQEMTIKNVETLRSGEKIILLLKKLLRVDGIGVCIEKPKTFIDFFKNETAIMRFLFAVTFEKTDEYPPGSIAQGDREKLISLLSYLKRKFDYDAIYSSLMESVQNDKKEFNISDYLPENEADSFFDSFDADGVPRQSQDNLLENQTEMPSDPLQNAELIIDDPIFYEEEETIQEIPSLPNEIDNDLSIDIDEKYAGYLSENTDFTISQEIEQKEDLEIIKEQLPDDQPEVIALCQSETPVLKRTDSFEAKHEIDSSTPSTEPRNSSFRLSLALAGVERVDFEFQSRLRERPKRTKSYTEKSKSKLQVSHHTRQKSNQSPLTQTPPTPQPTPQTQTQARPEKPRHKRQDSIISKFIPEKKSKPASPVEHGKKDPLAHKHSTKTEKPKTTRKPSTLKDKIDRTSSLKLMDISSSRRSSNMKRETTGGTIPKTTSKHKISTHEHHHHDGHGVEDIDQLLSHISTPKKILNISIPQTSNLIPTDRSFRTPSAPILPSATSNLISRESETLNSADLKEESSESAEEIVPVCELPVIQTGHYNGLTVEVPASGPLQDLNIEIREDIYLSKFLSKPHLNFLGMHPAGDFFVISVLSCPETPVAYRALKTDRRGFEEFHVKISLDPKNPAEEIEKRIRELHKGVKDLYYVHDKDKFVEEFQVVEKNHSHKIKGIKIAVVYSSEGQVDPQEMLSNSSDKCHSKFWDFMNILGRKIQLENWHGYRGDMGASSTGPTYYEEWHDIPIIYHVAPMLNSEGHRRLIGNDAAVIFFIDSRSDKSFDPSHIDKLGIIPQFFIVIQAFTSDKFRVGFFSRSNIKPFGPPCSTSIINGKAMKEVVLSKAYNGTLMTMICPPLGNLYIRPRAEKLKDIALRFPYDKKLVEKAYKQLEKDLLLFRRQQLQLVQLQQRIHIQQAQNKSSKDNTEASQNQASFNMNVSSAIDITESKLSKQQLQVHAKMREHVVTEIISTEVTYVESLNLIYQHLMQPIIEANFMEKEEIWRIFSNLDVILKHHQEFLKILKPKLDKWSPKSTIGKEFNENIPFITDYQPYLVNFNTSCLCLEQLSKKYHQLQSHFQTFEAQSAKLHGHKIPDILIMPIQRLPRYIMLLEQLKKFSIPGTIEEKILSLLTQNIQETLLKMNAQIQNDRVEVMEQVVNIRNSIINLTEKNFPVNLNRKLLKEGPLQLLRVGDGASDKRKYCGKKIYLFFFDDYILFTTKKKDKKEDQAKYEIIDSGPTKYLPVFLPTDIQSKKREFKIEWKGEDWLFESRTDEECSEWITVIEMAVR